MAIEWGSYDNHLRVGIDVTISPSNPTYQDSTVKVTWSFWADTDGWNFSDNNETYHYWGDGFDGTWSFDNHISGSAVKVGTHSENYSISSNSGSRQASAHLYGTWNGASPTKTRSVNLPDRPAAPPPPSSPPKIYTPSAGEALSASNITSTGATISWGPPDNNGGDGVDQYQLQVATGTGFGTIVYSTVFNESGSASHGVSGLNPNTKYYARVRAHNSAGWGDWTQSDYCPFTTRGTAPSIPGAPKLSTKSNTTISVSWNGSQTNGGGAITYNLQRSTTSDFSSGVTTINTTSTSNKSTGLVANTTYYFRVRATNSIGSSAYTVGLAVTTNTANPGGWIDAGNFVQLVNNFAHAVGDSIAHLGMYTYRVHTGAFTIPNNATVYIGMGTAPSGNYSRGPRGQGPSYIGTNPAGASDMQIKYPGTYFIEFGFHWPYSGANINKHGVQAILINGNADLLSTDQKGGLSEMILFTGSDGSDIGQYVMRHCVHLDVGDTVGFSLWQDTGVAMTTGTSVPVVAYSRITMVGF